MTSQAVSEAPGPAVAVYDSQQPSGLVREFFGSLDALRGVAALLVVLYHLPGWLDPVFEIQLIRHGYLMVNFFFVLSGFVLFHSYAGRIGNGLSFLKFVALRVSRLYPVHLLFVLPFAALEVAKYVAFRRYGMMGSSGVAPSIANIVTTFVANLFLVQGLGVTENPTPFNFPNWSISTEFYTYLVFAIGMLCFSRRGFRVFAIAIVALSVGALVGFGAKLGDLGNMPRCLSGFFFGCLTRAAFEGWRGRTLQRDWPSWIAALALLLLSLRWHSPVQGATWLEQLAMPISALLIVTLLLTPTSRLNRLLNTRPLRWLGEISYSLYMSHAIVQWVARQLCKPFETAVVVDGTARDRLPLALGIAAYVLVTLVTLLVARISYLLVEAPLRDKARRGINAWMKRLTERETVSPV